MKSTKKIFYVDGAGADVHGKGSGFAWVRKDKEKQRVQWIDGLTNNEAEYWALIDVLRYLARGSHAVIFTDSQLVAYQFSGHYRAHKPQLQLLLSRVNTIICEKRLEIEVRWIPRESNEAGELLER
ncbi:MAG: reverse transcriptase-like protein [Candidatus Sulfotelmatobacter sp.]|jgi:ribonuclease HI